MSYLEILYLYASKEWRNGCDAYHLGMPYDKTKSQDWRDGWRHASDTESLYDR